MHFHTLAFGFYFLCFYGVYLLTPRRFRNPLLLLVSAYFYFLWEWKFLALLYISALVNYGLGARIADPQVSAADKDRAVTTSVVFNLAVLGAFKYSHFFVRELAALLGVANPGWLLWIGLPAGLSYYTFQAMTYVFDLRRGEVKPARNFLDFALFVSFFPIVISGPIERAKRLLPQIAAERKVTAADWHQGSWLFLWGLFKKQLLADNLQLVTGPIFERSGSASMQELWVACFLFLFQIYADFSGYSDMARGVARVLGFEVMANFKYPFFAKNLNELWDRWHVSLTTWIRDYLYYPLALKRFGGRPLPAWVVLVAAWVLMGLWHEGEGRFVLWGLYHAGWLLLLSYWRKQPVWTALPSRSWTPLSLAGNFLTLAVFAVGLLAFALPTSSEVLIAASRLFAQAPSPGIRIFWMPMGVYLFFIALLLAVEFFQSKRDNEFVVLELPFVPRAAVYCLLLYLYVHFANFGVKSYVYAQF